ncbi:hypothetical protein [Jiangella anatolica]|uniref:Uncharacterized protein n=1 Tax=Jiangella anatolica TaxID=2670374 RepID=A0A2W2B7K1_9ACTN|nr:hypothetical protein [Jiangella anatolica]PZF83235.1 hypothetical protein C1I92_13235 [Jiangella anatolica]
MADWSKPENTGGNAEFFKPKENVGALVGFKVRRFEADYKNRFEEVRDTLFADVTVFTGPNAGKAYENAEITSTVVIKAMREQIGESVLGRLAKVKNYYVLNDPTDEDFEIAAGGSQPAKAKAPWES